jgi:SAM-dependent methyltransferase
VNHREVGEYWEGNAEVWTRLARQGCDVYRDHVNTPAFLALLPDVAGLAGLDIGCGEGHNTRLLARRGARMTALDICPTFVRYAREEEAREPLGIEYFLASAVELPFADAAFEFVTGFMSFMDIPEQDRVVREAYRVLRPGGFLQFSICHPCFQTARWKWVRDAEGRKVAVECGDYFAPPDGRIEEWIFGHVPAEQKDRLRPFRIPVFYRNLAGWINLLLETGFVLTRLGEPFADDEALRRFPNLADTRVVAYFLHLHCRKPSRSCGDTSPKR